MITVRTMLIGAVLAAGTCGVLVGCTSVSVGPTYSDFELQVTCERQGGWWRGYLIAGFCDYQSGTIP